MDATTRAENPEAEVHALLDTYFDAVRAMDLQRIVGHYTADIVAYDAIAALAFNGRDAYAAHWKTCMEMCTNMVFEPRDLTVAASGDVAFAHCLIRCGGTGADGQQQTAWMRASLAARRGEAGWRIVHEHYSMPFDPESGRMLDNLEPPS